MYINCYKAKPYSYTDKNFQTLEEAKTYLHISECPDFKTNHNGELSAEVGEWEVTLKEGVMEDEGEGYVDMLEESGALEAMRN